MTCTGQTFWNENTSMCTNLTSIRVDICQLSFISKTLLYQNKYSALGNITGPKNWENEAKFFKGRICSEIQNRERKQSSKLKKKSCSPLSQHLQQQAQQSPSAWLYRGHRITHELPKLWKKKRQIILSAPLLSLADFCSSLPSCGERQRCRNGISSQSCRALCRLLPWELLMVWSDRKFSHLK